MSDEVSLVTTGDVNRALDRAGGTDSIQGNSVQLMNDGPDNYRVMLDLIAGAKRRIHLENYIIRSDHTGRAFTEALADQAAAGVRVRVLVDWLGSFGTKSSQWHRLRRAGVEVHQFSRPRLRDPLALINRDHRKLLVVDGARAVTGGLCIGDEWMGDPTRGRLPWRDTGVAVDGPAARVMDLSFGRTWAVAGGGAIDDPTEVDHDVAAAGTTAVRVVATRPGKARAWRVLDMLLALGSERIWATDAYLAAPPRLYQVFQDAARDGVDVRLMLPGASDLPLVRDLSRTGYRRLLGSGVRIWEWGGSMLHAKTTIIDGRWVRIGSSNLNHSSLIANWEIDLFIEDRGLAEAMERQFEIDQERSDEVVTRYRPHRPVLRRATSLVVADRSALPQESRRPRGLVERRRRAVLRATALARAARSALFATAAGVLIGLAALLIWLPRLAAYTTAVLAIVVALALLASSIGRRTHG